MRHLNCIFQQIVGWGMSLLVVYILDRSGMFDHWPKEFGLARILCATLVAVMLGTIPVSMALTKWLIAKIEKDLHEHNHPY